MVVSMTIDTNLASMENTQTCSSAHSGRSGKSVRTMTRFSANSPQSRDASQDGGVSFQLPSRSTSRQSKKSVNLGRSGNLKMFLPAESRTPVGASLFEQTRFFHEAIRRPQFEREMEGSNKIHLDPDSLREAVDQGLRKHEYDVKEQYKEHSLWSDIARSSYFENFTLAVIMFNALWMSYETDANDAESLLQADPIFQVMDHFFCVFFSFEWCCRFFAFDGKHKAVQDAWFLFDSALVFMMVMETWVMTIALLASGSGVTTGGFTSILRLLRLLRLTRMARMLRSMPELMVLIRGMVASTRSVFFTLCLLFIIMYVFAIIFRQMAADTDTIGEKFFATIPESMYTLLVVGVFMDNLQPTIDQLGSEGYIYPGLFFIFIFFASLTVMNMLIGVLCEVVSAVSETEQEESSVAWVKSKITPFVKDKAITKNEFAALINNAGAVVALHEVGVDPVGLFDFVDEIFDKDEATEPFKDGESAMNENGDLCRIVKRRGRFYQVVWEDEPGVTRKVKSSTLYKPVDDGDKVKCQGREGTIVGSVDEDGFFKVKFHDDLEPQETSAMRAELDKIRDSKLTLDDFIDVVLKFRGTNRATIKDMVDIRKSISLRAKSLEERLMHQANRAEDEGEIFNGLRNLAQSVSSALSQLNGWQMMQEEAGGSSPTSVDLQPRGPRMHANGFSNWPSEGGMSCPGCPTPSEPDGLRELLEGYAGVSESMEADGLIDLTGNYAAPALSDNAKGWRSGGGHSRNIREESSWGDSQLRVTASGNLHKDSSSSLRTGVGRSTSKRSVQTASGLEYPAPLLPLQLSSPPLSPKERAGFVVFGARRHRKNVERLQQLEATGTQVLLQIQKLRKALQAEAPGACPDAVPAEGVLGFAPRHPAIRLVVARLEATMLTAWTEEIDRLKDQPTSPVSPNSPFALRVGPSVTGEGEADTFHNEEEKQQRDEEWQDMQRLSEEGIRNLIKLLEVGESRLQKIIPADARVSFFSDG